MNLFNISVIALLLIIFWFIYKKISARATDYTDVKNILGEAEVYIAYGFNKNKELYSI